MKTLTHCLPAMALAIATSGICADAIAAPLQRFAGEWINVDEQTRSIKRIVITKEGDKLLLNTWGSGGGGTTEIPHKQRKLLIVGSNVGDMSPNYGFASYDAGFKDVHNVVHLEMDRLILESFNIFKDESRRTNYRVREVFKRKKE